MGNVTVSLSGNAKAGVAHTFVAAKQTFTIGANSARKNGVAGSLGLGSFRLTGNAAASAAGSLKPRNTLSIGANSARKNGVAGSFALGSFGLTGNATTGAAGTLRTPHLTLSLAGNKKNGVANNLSLGSFSLAATAGVGSANPLRTPHITAALSGNKKNGVTGTLGVLRHTALLAGNAAAVGTGVLAFAETTVTASSLIGNAAGGQAGVMVATITLSLQGAPVTTATGTLTAFVGGVVTGAAGAALASVWQIGPRITAQVLGLPFTVYRPIGSGAVATQANTRSRAPVWITGDSKLKATKAVPDKTCLGYAAFDPAIVAEGDYLVGSVVLGAPQDMFFVACMDLPNPIEVILCNQVVSLFRDTTTMTGGDTRTALAIGWPGALIHGGGRSGKPPEELPDLAMMGGMTLLLPASFPAQPRAGDVVLDGEATPNDYTVQGVQHGQRGWVLYLSGN